jgi:hypothetical protein
MPPKVIKLGKKDDIASVIQQIKSLRDREIIFELAAGSVLLSSSDSLKLLKRTGEALGKTVKVITDDEIGRILAKKANVLYGDAEVTMPKNVPRVARSDVKPRFSDIMGSRKIFSTATNRAIQPAGAAVPAKPPQNNTRASRSTSNFSKIFIFGVVILVVAVFGLAVLLPKATIAVFARSEQVSRDLELTVDNNTSAADPDNLQIPGVPIAREVSQTKNFPATGVKLAGTKAAGTVTIYNFTASTLTLKAATTTLVASGKKYLFAKDVAGIKPNGVANPDIAITADLPGEAQNLPAETKFQIVNSALGNQNVYAVNPSGIGGGQATSTTVLAQADIDKAVESLTNDVVTAAESDLSLETGVATKLVSSGIKIDILAKTANKNVGDEVDSFDMTMIAKVTGLGFKNDDVINLVEAKINQVLSADKYLLDNAQKQYIAEFKTIDIPNSRGVLAVHFQTTAAYKVDTANLPKILAGKNESEIKEILLSKPEIDNVKVEFWPRWFVNKAPKFNGKIYIKTELSQNN